MNELNAMPPPGPPAYPPGTTLRTILSQYHPAIPYSAPQNHALKNSLNTLWPSVDIIGQWNDFTIQNLNNMSLAHGNILDIPVPQPWLVLARRHQPNLTLNNTEVFEMNSARALTQYNSACMGTAIMFLMTLQLYPGLSAPDIKTVNNKRTVAYEKTFLRLPEDKSTHVDHYMLVDATPSVYLLVGIVRTSGHFCAMTWANGVPPNSEDNKFRPVRQLARLCEKANVRYGYIQTNEELSVWCFDATGADARVNARFTVIPWSVIGPQSLTTEKALLWLCMLSLGYPAHRSIGPTLPDLATL